MSLTPIELRHTLHQNPELAFKEFKTTELIVNSVQTIDKSKKLLIHSPFPTGVLFEYKVNNREYLLFRADIDALAIKEKNEIEFKSKNNYMHACGHDIHTSILYSFLNEVLNKKPHKNILFLFQPAEEAGGGAMQFYNTGVFNQFKIKNAFALHVSDEFPVGTIASTAGVLFASALEVDIEFIGESAHVAFPSEGKNAFSAMRKFLDKKDMLVKDLDEPFIFGIGKYISGDVRNITPGYAKLEGTIRGLSEKKVLRFLDEVRKILNEVKKETGVNFKITTGAHYPEVINDKTLFKELSGQISGKFNFIDCGFTMTGEDFGFFSHRWSSFMFWLGTNTGKKYGLHNPRFLPPDDVIEIGKNVFSEIILSE